MESFLSDFLSAPGERRLRISKRDAQTPVPLNLAELSFGRKAIDTLFVRGSQGQI